MAKEMKPLLVPEGTLIAEMGDEPVAFVIAVPDINVALRHINGRLTWFGLPIGLLKLLYYERKYELAGLSRLESWKNIAAPGLPRCSFFR